MNAKEEMKDFLEAVKVLGVGSLRDQAMVRSVKMAALELDIPVDIVLISDLNEFLHFGISGIPALVIRDRVVASGRVPAVAEIKQLLREAIEIPPALT